jgi:hypothetical protein
MDKDIVRVVAKLLEYSFISINYNYNSLTMEEKMIIEDQSNLNKIRDFINKSKV